MSKLTAAALIALAGMGLLSTASNALADRDAPQHNFQDNQALRDIAALHHGDQNVNQTASRPVQSAGQPVQSAVVPGVAGCAGPAAVCNPAQ